MIKGLTKKESQKQKRSDGEAEIEKSAASGEAPTSIGGAIEVILMASADLGTKIMIGRTMVGLSPLIDVRLMEMIPIVASPVVPIIVEEGEVQVTMPMVFIVTRESVVAKVAKEKELVAVYSPMIEVCYGSFPDHHQNIIG